MPFRTPTYWSSERRWKFQHYITALVVTCLGPLSAQAADTVLAQHAPQLEQKLSSLPLFTSGAKLCTRAITVCAREMQPLGVELGGTFTVRVEDHYQSTYECRMINETPTWVPTSVEGSCEAQPIIMLPAKYDATEAWNVG